MTDKEIEEKGGSGGNDAGGGIVSGCMRGCSRLLMMFVLLNAAILFLVLVAGLVVYLNWGKFGPPLIEKAEKKLVSLPIIESIAQQMGFASMTDLLQKMEANLDDIEKGIAEGGTAGPPARRPIAATVPFMVNPTTYGQYVNREDVLVLVDYYLTWYEPSKRQLKDLTTLARQHGDIVIVLRVNLDRDKEFASNHGVRADFSEEHYLEIREQAKKSPDSKMELEQLERSRTVPDLRILHKGRELRRMRGLQPYPALEDAVLSLESVLPRPKRPTLPRSQPGGSPETTPSQPGIDGLPEGMSRNKK